MEGLVRTTQVSLDQHQLEEKKVVSERWDRGSNTPKGFRRCCADKESSTLSNSARLPQKAKHLENVPVQILPTRPAHLTAGGCGLDW